MMEFSAIHRNKLLSISFTRMLMGQKEKIESGGLLGLGTKIKVENVHKIGK